MLTAFDPGRMIWNGYTGAAGWMFRQALEGVLGRPPARQQARLCRTIPGRPVRRVGPCCVSRETLGTSHLTSRRTVHVARPHAVV